MNFKNKVQIQINKIKNWEKEDLLILKKELINDFNEMEQKLIWEINYFTYFIEKINQLIK